MREEGNCKKISVMEKSFFRQAEIKRREDVLHAFDTLKLKDFDRNYLIN